KKPLQVAILSVEPSTGGIRALVGGSDFKRSQFDRTRRMKRQPGSAAKPFTYAAAIASRTVTSASIIDDSPVRVTLASNRTWEPKNYDQQFRGPVTVREAFEKSLNVPAVRIATNTGVGRVRDVLQRAGFSGDLSETPAIALGVDDVTMRELVSAYSVFPNLGARTDPHLIEKVEMAGGRQVYSYEPRKTDALDPAVAYVIHSLMRGVVLRGTASALNQSGLGHVAGKTGTTSNYRDAWFVGYVPDLLTAVWVGFDDGTPLRMSSGESAVPIWAAFMRGAPRVRGEIQPPPGVSVVQVEAASGRVWRPGCGPAIAEVFLAGSEPRGSCGGAFDGSQIYVQFSEPGTPTEAQLAEWDRANAGMSGFQAVDDPDAVETTEPDVVPDSVSAIDSANAEQQSEEGRRLEEQRGIDEQRNVDEQRRRDEQRRIDDQRRRERDSLRVLPAIDRTPPPAPPVVPRAA
ncbi:MAG: penicillin-binding transpeptidase domain-containing protein, partial [Gemmatimonadaceae bacterium]